MKRVQRDEWRKRYGINNDKEKGNLNIARHSFENVRVLGKTVKKLLGLFSNIDMFETNRYGVDKNKLPKKAKLSRSISRLWRCSVETINLMHIKLTNL